MTILRTCPICGEGFAPQQYRTKSCDKPSCKRQMHNLTRKGTFHRTAAEIKAIKAQIPAERKCAKCGKPFSPRTRRQVNCSTHCAGRADITLAFAIDWYRKHGTCITSSPHYEEGTATKLVHIHDEWRSVLQHLTLKLEAFYEGKVQLTDAEVKELHETLDYLSAGDIIHRTISKKEKPIPLPPTTLDKFISWKNNRTLINPSRNLLKHIELEERKKATQS